MKTGVTVLACLLALYAALVVAQQPPAPTLTPQDTERPEYRARRLPSDTFKPSEKVQEDFPVPFPEDI